MEADAAKTTETKCPHCQDHQQHHQYPQQQPNTFNSGRMESHAPAPSLTSNQKTVLNNSNNNDTNTITNQKVLSLIEQYQSHEQQYQSTIKSLHVKLELWKAKSEQQRQVTNGEVVKVAALRAQIASFVKTEHELRRQLQIYVDKFKQVSFRFLSFAMRSILLYFCSISILWL
jgi:hypothetical protein